MFRSVFIFLVGRDANTDSVSPLSFFLQRLETIFSAGGYLTSISVCLSMKTFGCNMCFYYVIILDIVKSLVRMENYLF